MVSKIIFKNKYIKYCCQIYIITSFMLLIYSLGSVNFTKVFPTLIILQIVAYSCGSFLGFLFGLPSYNDNKSEEKYHRNSSLKEITSWLTKIIVGVTLIEFKDIYQYLKTIIKSLALSLDSSSYSNHSFIIASIIILFFILGFISFFILTATSIFEEFVKNDKNIENLLSDTKMNPNELHIDTILELELKDLDSVKKNLILEYVGKNGVTSLNNSLITKRLAKCLYFMEEYAQAAKAYEYSYEQNKDEIYSLLNACYIRSKFLKEFDKSNQKLKELIKEKPNFAPAFYNLACNYNREFNELSNNEQTDYIIKLKENAENYLRRAFEKDKGLFSEASNDSALKGLDINKIFKLSKNEE